MSTKFRVSANRHSAHCTDRSLQSSYAHGLLTFLIDRIQFRWNGCCTVSFIVEPRSSLRDVIVTNMAAPGWRLSCGYKCDFCFVLNFICMDYYFQHQKRCRLRFGYKSATMWVRSSGFGLAMNECLAICFFGYGFKEK